MWGAWWEDEGADNILPVEGEMLNVKTELWKPHLRASLTPARYKILDPRFCANATMC